MRQVRKTRGRDAQSAEKLRKLRKELEDARQLVAMVKQRELTRREMLALDRLLFEQRAKVKEMKRSLGIKGDDEDLINQKVGRLPPRFCDMTNVYCSNKRKSLWMHHHLNEALQHSCAFLHGRMAGPLKQIWSHCRTFWRRRRTRLKERLSRRYHNTGSGTRDT